MKKDKFTINGRIGSGTLTVTDDGFVLIQRDKNARKYHLSFDISSGICEATYMEKKDNPQTPYISLLLRLLSEQHEIIPKTGNSFVVHIPDIEDTEISKYFEK